MPKALWNGTVVAEASTENTRVVEGNIYFPASAVHQEFLRPNSSHTTCPWKGVASYYDLEVAGKTNRGAAWYYPEPKPEAAQIKDYIAFWKGVEVRP
jgi:uncharacterized protein (DUF427 family)